MEETFSPCAVVNAVEAKMREPQHKKHKNFRVSTGINVNRYADSVIKGEFLIR